MITVSKSELMVNDIFNVELKDNNIKVKIYKIGDKSVDVLVNDEEKVCSISSLIPIELTDDILTKDFNFQKRQLKTDNEVINDLFRDVNDEYFISLTRNGESYNLLINKILDGEKVCESFNIKYSHTLQNIIRSNIKLEIIYG